MSQTLEDPERSVSDPIKIGSIGTISSLMSQELDSANSLHVSLSFQKKHMNCLPSAPCVSIHKSSHPGEIPSTEVSSRDDNHRTHHFSTAENPRQKVLKNGQRCSTLSDDTHMDRKTRRNTVNKKGRTCLVEIVDIKCNNPMSSRLKKLGFSKLSETIG